MKDWEGRDYSRYLAAKKTVDDRALNPAVAQALHGALATWPGPLAILDVGCGTGATVERCLEGLTFTDASYTALDHQPELLAKARRRLPVLGRNWGWQVKEDSHRLLFFRENQHIDLAFVPADLLSFAADQAGKTEFDLVIAHHVLDLFHLDQVLPILFRLLKPGGLFYFTLNFDGATLFLPVIGHELDDRIEVLYHGAMERQGTQMPTPGACHTGRRLVTAIAAAGGRILAAGSSSWVVHPVYGQYQGDEAYFLHAIVATVEKALSGHPDLESGTFQTWVQARHRQIEAGELTYIAHHLDFFGRVR
jgi:SAM-dependent methyltransferase